MRPRNLNISVGETSSTPVKFYYQYISTEKKSVTEKAGYLGGLMTKLIN